MSITNLILRRFFTGTFSKKECSHLDQIRDVMPEADVCLKCVELGDTWPDLRVCLTCGYVGCCEDAKNYHALRHYRETGHPIVKPLATGMLNRWMWCYSDQALLDLPA